MIRRFGTFPKAGQSYRLRPGVYGILQLGDDLLCTFQEEPQPELQLPGGGVDPGEHPVAALHREVMEETGFVITRPRRMGAFRRFTFMPEYNIWAEKLCTIYTARPVRPHGPPTEAGHHAVWMPLRDAAHQLANDGDRSFVSRLLV